MINYGTNHIAYLSRDFLLEDAVNFSSRSKEILKPAHIELLRVRGISRPWGRDGENIIAARTLMEDMTAGLNSVGAPLLYMMLGNASQIQLFIGTAQFDDRSWFNRLLPGKSRKPQADGGGDLAMVSTSLRSAYPGIELQIQADTDIQQLQQRLRTFTNSAILTGTPTNKIGAELTGVNQLERLTRGLYGREWAYMVVATPITEQDTVQLHNTAVNELRLITDSIVSANKPNPLAKSYQNLLEQLLEKIRLGKAHGLWHTAVYILTTDAASHKQAVSLMKSVFSGSDSLPDPIRIISCSEIIHEIPQFALNTEPGPTSPGGITYPYRYLNMHNSHELSAMTHLPREEVPGYFVKQHKVSSGVDITEHQTTRKKLEIGTVLYHGQETENSLCVTHDELKKHLFTAGLTGAGKTNTMFHLLQQAWQQKIPFLVLEPAKTEYRKLIQSEMGGSIQVFTVGNEMVSPFRLNPFEIRPGVPIQAHIDRLVAIFTSSFNWFGPTPYILERCIHEVYADKGWDLVTGENSRGFHRLAHPTLTDLYKKVGEIAKTLNYSSDTKMEIQGALETRIDSLRQGGKGLTLDTNLSIPMAKLVEQPTVIELEQLENAEKAFVMGLLLTNLYEYLVAQGLQESTNLKHITVIEEAHRLLQQAPLTENIEMVNVKGKALEIFSEILTECRSFGESLWIVEQMPRKLTPEVIANTGTKILHRTVAIEDRALMAGAMNIAVAESQYISSLLPGEAVVFHEGQDDPVHIRVPFSKINSQPKSRIDEDAEIAEKMQSISAQLQEMISPAHLSRLHRPAASSSLIKAAQRVAENPELQEMMGRWILSTVFDESAFIQAQADVNQVIRKLTNSAHHSVALFHQVIFWGMRKYFAELGETYGLSFDAIEKLEKMFVAILPKPNLEHQVSSDLDLDLISEFQIQYKKLLRVAEHPFRGCEKVCPRNTCFYRHNVQVFLKDERLDKLFRHKLEHVKSPEKWNELDALFEIVARRAFGESVLGKDRTRLKLCFCIQKSESLQTLDYHSRENVFINVLNQMS